MHLPTINCTITVQIIYTSYTLYIYSTIINLSMNSYYTPNITYPVSLSKYLSPPSTTSYKPFIAILSLEGYTNSPLYTQCPIPLYIRYTQASVPPHNNPHIVPAELDTPQCRFAILCLTNNKLINYGNECIISGQSNS